MQIQLKIVLCFLSVFMQKNTMLNCKRQQAPIKNIILFFFFGKSVQSFASAKSGYSTRQRTIKKSCKNAILTHRNGFYRLRKLAAFLCLFFQKKNVSTQPKNSSKLKSKSFSMDPPDQVLLTRQKWFLGLKKHSCILYSFF